MTREEAKELLPLIQAFAEGKKIEYSVNGKNWSETEKPIWDNYYIYRIKPESTYRPFNNGKECLEEMMKHQPFGLVKYYDKFISIISIDYFGVKHLYEKEPVNLDYSESLRYLKFIDGAPFGIKKE